MKSHGDRLAGTPFLKKRQVIVQPSGHTLSCKELFLFRPCDFARHWMPGVVDRIPAEPGVGGSRYIYCRREAEASLVSTMRVRRAALEGCGQCSAFGAAGYCQAIDRLGLESCGVIASHRPGTFGARLMLMASGRAGFGIYLGRRRHQRRRLITVAIFLRGRREAASAFFFSSRAIR
jgi:hypothetical protein